VTVTVTETQAAPEGVEEALGKLMSIYAGSLLNYMIDIGHRTGLLAAAAEGPGTSEELASRAGLTERYVREWLGAMVTGGLVDYNPAGRTYVLPAAMATCLTPGPMDMAPFAAFNTTLGKHVHKVARAFTEGGGVPYAEYRPEFTDQLEQMGIGIYDGLLVDAYLPLVPGLTEQLDAGARVADVCCGSGHALVVLARRFPASTFVGYDFDDRAIAKAKAEAAGAGLANVTFHVADAARLTVDEPFDVVFVFDAIHDQVDPEAVLRNIAAALKPGGVFVLKEPRAADTLEDNIGNPMAPVMFACSTLHCLPVSLAHDGAGIGTAFGEQHARRLLAEAGFDVADVHVAPGDPGDGLYVSRTAGGAR
jgi:SAM-dependent methyltransferase